MVATYSDRIDIYEICTDDLPDVASDRGVVSVPTIQIYSDGEVVDTIVGCVARNVLGGAVDKVLEELDPGPDDEVGGHGVRR